MFKCCKAVLVFPEADSCHGAAPRQCEIYASQNRRTSDLFAWELMNDIQSARRRRLPSLHQLRAFEAAARHGSITRAAAELHVTQSAVSHQVKALETHLGMALIQRRGRDIVLTPAGAAYFPELEAALDRMAAATERIAFQPARASLTVNATSSFAARWLIPRLASFCAAQPGIDVRLATTAKMLDFSPHEFDVSIRCFDEATLQAMKKRRDWEGVASVGFLPETKFPVCSPQLLRLKDRPLKKPADLRHHTLLHARSAPEAWREWLVVARVPKLKRESELTFEHMHFALQAASRGMGLAMGSLPLVQEELDNGTLVIPFPGVESDPKFYHLLYASTPQAKPEVEAFSRWLLAAPAEPPPTAAGTAALPPAAARRRPARRSGGE
jgi:LysR family glycine cleavage system transcriptional activator